MLGPHPCQHVGLASRIHQTQEQLQGIHLNLLQQHCRVIHPWVGSLEQGRWSAQPWPALLPESLFLSSLLLQAGCLCLSLPLSVSHTHTLAGPLSQWLILSVSGVLLPSWHQAWGIQAKSWFFFKAQLPIFFLEAGALTRGLWPGICRMCVAGRGEWGVDPKPDKAQLSPHVLPGCTCPPLLGPKLVCGLPLAPIPVFHVLGAPRSFLFLYLKHTPSVSSTLVASAQAPPPPLHQRLLHSLSSDYISSLSESSIAPQYHQVLTS